MNTIESQLVSFSGKALGNVVTEAAKQGIAPSGNSLRSLKLYITVVDTEGSTASTGLDAFASIYKIEILDAAEKIAFEMYGSDIANLGYFTSPIGKKTTTTFNGTASATVTNSFAIDIYNDISSVDLNKIIVKLQTLTGFDANSTATSVSLTVNGIFDNSGVATVHVDRKSFSLAAGNNVTILGNTLGESLSLKALYVNVLADTNITSVSLVSNSIHYYDSELVAMFIEDEFVRTYSGHQAGWFVLLESTSGLVVNSATELSFNVATAFSGYFYRFY